MILNEVFLFRLLFFFLFFLSKGQSFFWEIKCTSHHFKFHPLLRLIFCASVFVIQEEEEEEEEEEEGEA